MQQSLVVCAWLVTERRSSRVESGSGRLLRAYFFRDNSSTTRFSIRELLMLPKLKKLQNYSLIFGFWPLLEQVYNSC